jgi:hypothetical protein
MRSLVSNLLGEGWNNKNVHTAMLIFLNDVRKQKEKPSSQAEYSDEVLSANWNPAIEHIPPPARGCTLTAAMPPTENFAVEDPEAFLSRVYALAILI